MEAAVLLPTVMLLVGMLVQPVCLLYARSVMRATASECARILLTSAVDEDELRAFALRRLAAVPEVSAFHVGGDDDWETTFERDDASVTVGVAGHARPLPLLGIVATAFGASDDVGVVLRVEVVERLRPEWLGGDYDDWVDMWG